MNTLPSNTGTATSVNMDTLPLNTDTATSVNMDTLPLNTGTATSVNMDTLPLNTGTATSVNMDTLPLNTSTSTTAVNTTVSIVNTTVSISDPSLGTNAQPLRVRLPPKDSMLLYVNDEKLTQREDLNKSPVINELLCFAHNRLQRLPVDFVVKLCVGFYSDDEIYIAKRTLYDTTEGKRKNCGRYKKHIGPNKSRDYLAKIDVQIGRSYYACAIGDFNANISSNDHRFGKELLDFCSSENLILSDQLLAPTDTFTFTSEAHGSTAWLDHTVSSKNLHAIIDKVWVDYDFISSDHFPMFMKISTNTVNISKEPTNKEKHITKHISWFRASEEDRLSYTRNTEKLISEIKLDHGLFLCDDVNCQDPAHQCAINRLYDDIIDALQTTGSFLLETKKTTIQANTWLERLVHRTAS